VIWQIYHYQDFITFEWEPVEHWETVTVFLHAFLFVVVVFMISKITISCDDMVIKHSGEPDELGREPTHTYLGDMML